MRVQPQEFGPSAESPPAPAGRRPAHKSERWRNAMAAILIKNIFVNAESILPNGQILIEDAFVPTAPHRAI
jgi:hypothetical protein